MPLSVLLVWRDTTVFTSAKRNRGVNEAPATIEKLPIEILRQILYLLPRKSLCAVARLNRRTFYEIALEFLYSDARISWHNHKTSRPLIISTLFRSARVGHLVRTLEISCCFGCNYLELWEALAHMNNLRHLTLDLHGSCLPVKLLTCLDADRSTGRTAYIVRSAIQKFQGIWRENTPCNLCSRFLPCLQLLRVESWRIFQAFGPSKTLTRIEFSNSINEDDFAAFLQHLSRGGAPSLQVLRLLLHYDRRNTLHSALENVSKAAPNLAMLSLSLYNRPWYDYPESVIQDMTRNAQASESLRQLDLTLLPNLIHSSSKRAISRHLTDLESLTAVFASLEKATIHGTQWRKHRGTWTPQPMPSLYQWWLDRFKAQTEKEMVERWRDAVEGFDVSYERLERISKEIQQHE